MGRSSEFHGGAAYGNFAPEPVDIDLSDKVTDHPFYEQPHTYQFHEPNEPKSKTCLYPGCGRQVHEHRSISMPPTRAAYDMMVGMADQAKTERRQGKEKEARESHENDELMKGPHGTGDHVMRGKGWSAKGPSNKRDLRTHMIEDHQVDPEDMDYIPHLARSHQLWHQQGDDDDHTHKEK